MSRPLRIEFPGALYHVTSRGDGREVTFLGDEDRHRFLDVLSELVHDFNWVVHAYCLMDNHYHLLIETPESNLSKGMRQLNGVYTQRFNRRHGRAWSSYRATARLCEAPHRLTGHERQALRGSVQDGSGKQVTDVTRLQRCPCG
jgi:REP element-mobilizing transposase RayT